MQWLEYPYHAQLLPDRILRRQQPQHVHCNAGCHLATPFSEFSHQRRSEQYILMIASATDSYCSL